MIFDIVTMSSLGEKNQSTPQGVAQPDSGFGSIGHSLNPPQSGSFGEELPRAQRVDNFDSESDDDFEDQDYSSLQSLQHASNQPLSLAIPDRSGHIQNERTETEINSDVVSSPDSTTSTLTVVGVSTNSVTNQTSDESNTNGATTHVVDLHEVGDLEESGMTSPSLSTTSSPMVVGTNSIANLTSTNMVNNLDTNGLTRRLDSRESRSQSGRENSITSDENDIPAQNPANLMHHDTSPAPPSREDTPSPVLSSVRAQLATVSVLETPIRTPVVESRPEVISERVLAERAYIV